MRALYAAATGMAAQQTRLDSISNNIANVQTTGYKRSRESFQDLFYQEMTHGGLSASSARIEVGAGVRLAAIDKDFQQGSVSQTGGALDVALEGRGFFEVQDPMSGQLLYTRDGSFRKDANGMLVTTGGLQVGGINIPDAVESVVIDERGDVWGAVEGNRVSLGRLNVVDFVNPAGMRSLGGNLYQQTTESGIPQPLTPGQDRVAIRQGFLEGSNVDIATELVQMILTQRAYELNSKAVQAADETLRVAANLRR
jgi:flagellar basal-body rod protein FlgG